MPSGVLTDATRWRSYDPRTRAWYVQTSDAQLGHLGCFSSGSLTGGWAPSKRKVGGREVFSPQRLRVPTTELCRAACRAENRTLFALGDGGACRCGTAAAAAEADSELPRSRCGSRCPSDKAGYGALISSAGHGCGGAGGAVSVYSVRPPTLHARRFSDIYTFSTTGAIGLSAAATLVAPDGSVLGVAASDYELNSIERYLYETYGEGDPCYARLMNTEDKCGFKGHVALFENSTSYLIATSLKVSCCKPFPAAAALRLCDGCYC